MTSPADGAAGGTHVPAAPPPTGFPLERVLIWDIRAKWIDLDARALVLGEPLGVEHRAPDGVGWVQEFANGVICWHPRLGACEIHGRTYDTWRALGGTAFGYPVAEETECGDGHVRRTRFRAMHLPETPEASISWSAEDGAPAVLGVAWDRRTSGSTR